MVLILIQKENQMPRLCVSASHLCLSSGNTLVLKLMFLPVILVLVDVKSDSSMECIRDLPENIQVFLQEKEATGEVHWFVLKQQVLVVSILQKRCLQPEVNHSKVKELLSADLETLPGVLLLKATELGGKVVTISGPDGYVYDPDGISGKKIEYMLELRASNEDIVKPYSYAFEGVEFHEGKHPWEVKVDIALPCATQNELTGEDAQKLINNGCICICEGANMPSTPEAVEIIQKNGLLFAPGKASNAGGVATSGLEMTQNSMKLRWNRQEVDDRLT